MDFGESKGIVQKFASSMHVPFEMALGSDPLYTRFDLDAPPANLLIGPNGRILYAGEALNDAEIVRLLRPIVRNRGTDLHRSRPHTGNERHRASLRVPVREPGARKAVASLSGSAADSGPGNSSAANSSTANSSTANSSTGNSLTGNRPTGNRPTGSDHAPAASTAVRGPFRDVPSDHWAAAAVEALRLEGIVIGYP